MINFIILSPTIINIQSYEEKLYPCNPYVPDLLCNLVPYKYPWINQPERDRQLHPERYNDRTAALFILYRLWSDVDPGRNVNSEIWREKMPDICLGAIPGRRPLSVFNVPVFPVFLCPLFLIGCGMAILQVASYPLLRVSGGEEHFAFNSVIAQLVFGAASFLSPFVYS